MTKLLALSCLLVGLACAPISTTGRPESYYRSGSSEQDKDDLAIDSSSPTNADIERMLAHRLVLAKQNRIAIVSLSGLESWRFYAADFVQMGDAIDKDLVERLRKSTRVYDASFLPAMLVPEKRSVAHLREAAARYQADLVFAYRTRCNSYDRTHVFGASEVRAYCTVDAVLMDVRTGIVPFTSVATNNVESLEKADDKNFSETIRRNELRAIGKSLAEIASSLVRFVDQMPAQQ